MDHSGGFEKANSDTNALEDLLSSLISNEELTPTDFYKNLEEFAEGRESLLDSNGNLLSFADVLLNVDQTIKLFEQFILGKGPTSNKDEGIGIVVFQTFKAKAGVLTKNANLRSSIKSVLERYYKNLDNPGHLQKFNEIWAIIYPED